MTADAEHLSALAAVAGITVPEEDLDPLIAALRNNLEAAQQLAAVPLDDGEPILDFDPRWR